MNQSGWKVLLSELFPDESIRQVISLVSHQGDHHSFYIETKSGQGCNLRLFHDASIDRSNDEFQRLLFLYRRFSCVPQPLRHGLCTDGQQRYLLSRWIRGDLIRRRLGHCGVQEDYASGIDYSLALKQLHSASLLAPRPILQTSARLSSADDCQSIAELLDGDIGSDFPVRMPAQLIRLVRDASRIWTRPGTAWLHGRPRLEDAVLTPRSGLVLTGVTGRTVGHPYRDLAMLALNTGVRRSVFLTGVLDGYFAGEARSRSYQWLRLFIAIEILRRIERWRTVRPERTEIHRIQEMITSYRDFYELIPAWYQPLPEFSVK